MTPVNDMMPDRVEIGPELKMTDAICSTTNRRSAPPGFPDPPRARDGQNVAGRGRAVVVAIVERRRHRAAVAAGARSRGLPRAAALVANQAATKPVAPRAADHAHCAQGRSRARTDACERGHALALPAAVPGRDGSHAAADDRARDGILVRALVIATSAGDRGVTEPPPPPTTGGESDVDRQCRREGRERTSSRWATFVSIQPALIGLASAGAALSRGRLTRRNGGTEIPCAVGRAGVRLGEGPRGLRRPLERCCQQASAPASAPARQAAAAT